MPIAIAQELAPAYTAEDAATFDTLASTCLLLNYFGDVFNWAVATPLYAIAILKTGALPRWVGYVGLVAAVFAGWLGMFGPLSSAIEGISAIGFFAFFVFLASMGVTILRRRGEPVRMPHPRRSLSRHLASRGTLCAMKVLVVDDERAVRDSLRRALELEGYDVELAVDGADALHRLEANGQPDAVILDVLMPGVDGLEVCRRIRGKGNGVPVLMLTARTEVESRVAGLDAGADDYLAKPFALEELLARLRALLRRVTPGAEETLRFADLELNPNTREVNRGGETIELTRTEFNLLELFLRNPRQVLTRSVIFERVWGYDFGFASNSLDVYIGYLRRKTEANSRPRLIQTVRGVGYALREP